MANGLKPCPFCGGEAAFLGDTATIKCKDCGGAFIVTNPLKSRLDVANAWNMRTTIETNIYDKEEIYTDCTVQILTNTKTGETSVGWWKNGGAEDGKIL